MPARSPNKAQAWLDLGLALLAREGPAALTIERLCAEAGKTKGAYYHHFADQAAYADALMARWRETATGALIQASDQAGGPAERGRRLDELSAALDVAVEIGVRRLVAGEPRLAPALKTVDDERVAYVAALLAQHLGIEPADALERAWIEYAAFIGLQWLRPDGPMLERVRRRLAGLLQGPAGAA